MKAIHLLVLAACGDNFHVGETAVDAAGSACSASFTGEIVESSSSPADCPNLAGSAVDFAIPVAGLGGSVLSIELDLPSVIVGSFSSETIPSWSASVFEAETDGGCLYRAGNAATPEGAFQLGVTSVAPLHGALTMSLAILTLPGSTCGPLDTETLTSRF